MEFWSGVVFAEVRLFIAIRLVFINLMCLSIIHLQFTLRAVYSFKYLIMATEQ